MSLTLIAAVRRNKPKRNVNFIAASSADTFALALQKNGRAWAWGRNLRGNLGDNSLINKHTPVSVLGAVKTFCQISNGTRHSLAIDKNGRAWGWGYNNQGQLGDNTTTSRLTPVSILGAVKTFCQITGDNTQSLAIDKNGRAWGWGNNGNGQLGDNSTTLRLTPVSVLGTVKTFCKIDAGDFHGLVIDKNGRVWAWGNNNQGQLGDNSVTQRLTPVSVLGAIKTFCHIGAGSTHSLAIDKNGRAWGWGNNGYGRLGNNSTTSALTPVSVLGAAKTFCQISAGQRHSLAIDKDGRAWGWGYNFFGHLGDGSTTSRLTPVSVAGAVKTFCKINAGITHSIAIDKNGRAWGWGSVINGALGNNAPEFRTTPMSVLGAVKTFCQISAGGAHSLAIDKNGRAWGWGYNSNGGPLGIDSLTSALTPVSVLGAVKTFCKISGGNNLSLAIDKNGRAWGWGRNYRGSVGDNSITSRLTPVSVLGAVKTFCEISAGGGHSLAIDKNGRAWGWGNNYNRQLGDNSAISQRTPVSVLGAVKTFCQISAGGNHSLAIDKNGRAWGWGRNFNGQVGNNTTTGFLTGISTPVSVLGAVKTFCRIAANNNFSLAIDKNGRAWGWGSNAQGQLGDNSVTQRLTPVSVLGTVKTFCQISGGSNSNHSLAIDKNGRIWAWGINTNGQLGDNSTTSRLTPVSVLGAVKTFCQINAANQHSLAIDKNGRVWAWGGLDSGRLGINKDAIERTPVQVCNI